MAQSNVLLRRTDWVASLIGRLGQALSGYLPPQCRCRSRARASLRTRHQGPFHHGIRRRGGTIYWSSLPSIDGRSKRPNELTSSIVPRGTSFHRWVDLSFLLSDLILYCSHAAATSLV